MTDLLLTHEPWIRLAAFLSVLLAMMAWEVASPLRRAEVPRLIRWSNTLALVVLDGLLVRLCFPILSLGLAMQAETRGWGLLNLWDLPSWLAVMLAILALDLAIYLQHALFHAVPLLWRLHRMHHADPDFDTVTGLRFHPAEILVSTAWKLVVVAALGAPPLAVLVFEILLNATALFNHGNVALPEPLERVLRLVLVTPDMHRVHHAPDPVETNSNYGFNLPWWDWLFGTWRRPRRAGQEDRPIGLAEFRSPRDQALDRLLLQPLRKDR